MADDRVWLEHDNRDRPRQRADLGGRREPEVLPQSDQVPGAGVRASGREHESAHRLDHYNRQGELLRGSPDEGRLMAGRCVKATEPKTFFYSPTGQIAYHKFRTT